MCKSLPEDFIIGMSSDLNRVVKYFQICPNDDPGIPLFSRMEKLCSSINRVRMWHSNFFYSIVSVCSLILQI